jgi:hypothetical protein
VIVLTVYRQKITEEDFPCALIGTLIGEEGSQFPLNNI